ncbi:hypothetical protein [Streptomyces sp. BE303]|uniref:hypothetical protein n=1 Tax=Streptomyces sp. BE303 TaxID=3002528 RepID=UPI002E7A39F7|nr:hypothetical protein [Streptomyces sp. BE303]MED7952932.1 hypothetical protein [Streptomyces sp. BE303]
MRPPRPARHFGIARARRSRPHPYAGALAALLREHAAPASPGEGLPAPAASGAVPRTS